MLYYTKTTINKKYDIKALQVFEIAAIDMYARTIPIQHGLADMFKSTRHFTDRNSSSGYSCQQQWV